MPPQQGTHSGSASMTSAHRTSDATTADTVWNTLSSGVTWLTECLQPTATGIPTSSEHTADIELQELSHAGRTNKDKPPDKDTVPELTLPQPALLRQLSSASSVASLAEDREFFYTPPQSPSERGRFGLYRTQSHVDLHQCPRNVQVYPYHNAIDEPDSPTWQSREHAMWLRQVEPMPVEEPTSKVVE